MLQRIVQIVAPYQPKNRETGDEVSWEDCTVQYLLCILGNAKQCAKLVVDMP